VRPVAQEADERLRRVLNPIATDSARTPVARAASA
jgi:hypothetical protein